ncbi:MAG TPA: LacI family DNA-binding transcriptional regulator [Ktedonobacterales bacterium]|nr:LacI family DNA-binding transcriptional regulator [Ktedonobacterales bacterium]
MATIQDVAKRAGVSIATVSRVLNGAPRVNEEIVARVNAAIQELRYRPNNAARTLRANRSAIIGLLISDIQNSFHTALVRSVEDIAHQNGYSVILCNSDEDPEKERRYVEVLIAEHVAGAIVMPTSERSRTFRMLHQRHIPVVAVDRRLRDDQTDAVLVDNVRGSYDAVTHLISNGYRNIGLITGPLGTTTGVERRDGYRKALADAGIPLNPALERYGTFKEESGLQHAMELLSGSEPIDALFITNNQMTIGALLAIQNLGLRAPDDVALVAFDEMPWANLNAISLTTISQPAYELGSTAALRLIQRMQGGVPWTRQEFVLTSTLHVRNSSRPRTASGTTKRTVGARARH